MATPKRPTKEQANENKKKQQVLRTAGYNIKVDGSWGPWQEKQYRKVTSAKGGKTSQANVGVMALPVAGYGIAQLLEGLGSMSPPSISLPSISAPAAAMAAPVALTLAGPAYGLYETITGQHHQANITPQERQAMTYAPDATRVSRPIVVSRTRVGSQSQSRPIGEMYINPALTRTRSVSMASEAARDSTGTATAPRDSTGTVPSSAPQGNKPEDKKPEQDPKKSPVQEIKESAKRNLDRIKRGYTKIGKGFVNTTLYSLGALPFIAGGMWAYNAITDDEDKEQLSPADSTRISLTKQYEELQKEQENKRLKAKIDSINGIRQNPQQISSEDSVRNAALKRYLDDIQHGKN